MPRKISKKAKRLPKRMSKIAKICFGTAIFFVSALFVQASSNFINFTTSGGQKFILDNNAVVNGNFTIGNGAPTGAGAAGNVQITTGGASPINNRLTFGTDGTGWKFAIGKNQAGTVSDLLTVQDNGNVGIGTTSPEAYLDIKSPSAFQLYLSTARTGQPDARNWGIGTNQVAEGDLVFRQSTSNANTPSVDRMVINKLGNVGIGMTPGSTYKFDVAGPIRSAGVNEGFFADPRNGLGDTFGFYNPGGSARIWGNTNGDLMTITSAGNVGIGTTTPANKLDVAGGAEVDYLVVDAQVPGSGEGGEINLRQGSSSYNDVTIDNYQGTFRVIIGGAEKFRIAGDGTITGGSMIASGAYYQ